jgi:hypothetical protein
MLKKSAPVILFALSLVILLCLALPVNAKEPSQLQPQQWQIDGILAALADERDDVKQLALEKLVTYDPLALQGIVKPEILQAASKMPKDELSTSELEGSSFPASAYALGRSGGVTESDIPKLIQVLKDEKQDSFARISAATALSSFGDGTKGYISEIANVLINILKNKKLDFSVRVNAAASLGRLRGSAKPYIPDIIHLIQNNQDNSEVRLGAANALNDIGDSSKNYILEIANILKDKRQTVAIQVRLAELLGSFGEPSKVHIPEITNLLNDKQQAADGRIRTAAALSQIVGKLEIELAIPLLSHTYEEYGLNIAQRSPSEMRFYSYFFSGGGEDIKRLLRWVAKPKQLPERLEREEAVKTLEVFEKVWKLSEPYPELRADLAEKTALVVGKGAWQTQDIALLKRQVDTLKAANMTQAAAVQSAITRLEGWQWVMGFWQVGLLHAAGWLGLILAYPRSPMVQAIFFWNPWVRNFLGAGYVTFLLQWVPGLRRILFAPFQGPLLADARLEEFNPDGYFADAQVSWQRQAPYAEPRQSLVATFPRIQGQVILQGESGSGKTHFIRHLLRGYLGQKARRIVVYLPATRCSEGVIEAIQKKLHGEEIKDAKFLQSLIYSGALDICIDGLNEVSADTRAKITQFVESQFRGNILIATQPLEWTPPATAKTYLLHPLEPDQIERYLLSRQAGLPPNLPVRESAYEQACRVFLQEQLEQQPIAADRQTAQAILSNPMELSLAAGAIAAGHPPDLFHLRQQQYNLMAAEYHQVWHREFPLKAFAEATYQLWLTDKRTLPKAEFHNELACMEDEHYRMVISRQWQDADGKAHKEWLFRHDKIADFFLAQTFLGDSDTAQTRLLDHMGDSRFRGVYLLLATMMPAAAAADLRESLIHYAAETKDHTVSDEFVLLCAGAIARR